MRMSVQLMLRFHYLLVKQSTYFYMYSLLRRLVKISAPMVYGHWVRRLLWI
jgi:hypothetical protein